MAISFVGSVGGTAGGTDETVNFSSLLDEAGGTPTVQTDDVVIVTLCRRATSNTPCLITTAGYSSIYSNVYSNSSDDSNLISYYKVMGATPDSSVVITTTGFSNTQAYCVHVFRGVDTTTPFDGVIPTTATQTGAVGPDAPSITPTTAGAWICAAGGGAGTSAGNLTALTNPTNMSTTTNHFCAGTNTRAEVALALKTDWASGAFNPNAFGGGGTASGNGLSAATFVLKPAAGGGGSSQGLTPSLFTNSQSFFAPTVATTYGLTPNVVINSNSFFGPTATTAYTLAPSLVSNSNSFFGPTASATYVLTPGLVTNSGSFFGPTVSATYALTASLLTNDQTFYDVTITGGTITLIAPLLINTQTFYDSTVTVVGGGQALSQDFLFTNYNRWFSPDLSAPNRATVSLSFAKGRPLAKKQDNLKTRE